MSQTPRAAPKPGGLIRSSAIFAALTMVSRVMGLVRDLVITARLGASQTIAADAYYTALAFPNLFRRIFAEGAFAAAFVLWSGIRHSGREHPVLNPGAMATAATAFASACPGIGTVASWWFTSVTVVVLVFIAVERGQFRTSRPKACFSRSRAIMSS